MNSINICQWNCRSAISNKENLEILLQQYNINIALLSETWFKLGRYISFSGFITVRNDRQDGKGGVAILLGNGLQYSEIPRLNVNNIMYVAVKIRLSNSNALFLISVYVKPQSKISRNTWNHFFFCSLHL